MCILLNVFVSNCQNHKELVRLQVEYLKWLIECTGELRECKQHPHPPLLIESNTMPCSTSWCLHSILSVRAVVLPYANKSINIKLKSQKDNGQNPFQTIHKMLILLMWHENNLAQKIVYQNSIEVIT